MVTRSSDWWSGYDGGPAGSVWTLGAGTSGSSHTAANTGAVTSAAGYLRTSACQVDSAHLLVTLRVALPDRPGSGPDQPAPHLRAILPRYAGTQQSFEFRRGTQVIIRPAGQVLSPTGQQGALHSLLQRQNCCESRNLNQTDR